MPRRRCWKTRGAGGDWPGRRRSGLEPLSFCRRRHRFDVLERAVGAIGVGLVSFWRRSRTTSSSGRILLSSGSIKISYRVEGSLDASAKQVNCRARHYPRQPTRTSPSSYPSSVCVRAGDELEPARKSIYTRSLLNCRMASDPELVRQVLLAAAEGHRDVLQDPAPEVEFIEAGLGALRFQLQVWSSAHLKTAGALKSDLNFEVWRQSPRRSGESGR